MFDYDMEYQHIVQFFFMTQAFFTPVQTIGTQYTNALTAMADAERVFSVVDMQPEWEDRDNAQELRPLRGAVEFRDICFAYDPSKQMLDHISFTAEPGQTIALVGQTGSGKSTIISLIAKFYLPTAGNVLIDSVDIRELDGNSLHHQMGIVLQSNFLFTGTVMDNIRLGRPETSDTDVIAAAERLDCHDLVESLPQNFHTKVDKGGGSLSLDQRQLVCFTHAMLTDPHILILDETTSAVDTMTEARIQRALKILLAGRTSFVVAHRLSTIRHADQVLVLDHGKAIERGTHRQLLVRGGVYAELYRQFISAGESGAETGA